MKNIILICLLILSMEVNCQEHNIDSKCDTSFIFALTSQCKNVLDYNGILEGISDRFTPDNRQILELIIIKNCGQTTTLNVHSLIDSIVITRTDTGEMATCECFQKCTLTIDNVIDRIAFNMFGTNEYLINPFYSDIPENQLETELDILYHNNMITIIGVAHKPLKIRLINQNGQVVYNKEINGNSIVIPSDLNGLFICEIKKGDIKLISKKIYIN